MVRDRDGNPKRTLWQCSASVCVVDLRHRWCRSPVVSVIPVRPKTVHTSRVQQIFHHSLGVWRPSKLSVVANFICSLHCRLDLIDRKPWTVTTPPHLYADDTQVYGSRPPAAVDALSVKISDCIHDVANWTKSNRLQLNPDKTEAMWCTTSRRRHQLPSTAISIVGAPVIPAQCVRNLGIYIDADLMMRTHVQRTARGASPPYVNCDRFVN